MSEISRIFRLTALVLLVLSMAGCAFERMQSRANDMYVQGHYEDAVAIHKASAEENPQNARYLIAYYGMRDKAVAQLLQQAQKARQDSDDAQAKDLYQRVLRIDEHNTRAREGLVQLAAVGRHTAMLERANAEFDKGNLAIAQDLVRNILVENKRHPGSLALREKIEQEQAKPREQTDKKLADAFRTPISIEFRDAQLRQIFEILSRTSGLNFVLDRDVKGDQKTTIFLRNSTVAEALSLTLLTNQLEQRVLNSSSVLIYPNTAAKIREYEPLSVKSFVLNNGEAKNVANLLKTIVKSKDIVVDEKQNILTVRDSPEAIKLAEKLIAVHDLPEGEVMLDVEVLEVKRDKLVELGVQYPSQLSLAPLSTTGGSTVTLFDLLHMNSSSVSATLNSLTAKANDTVSDVNVLANPRIRTRNKEKAKIQVGEKVPNVTSTSTSTGFVAESIQYVDVGLKLEVEPTIAADDEVAIKVALEVSDILSTMTTKNGSTAYEIGTRNASTVLRLRDGENQILAGLIKSEDRRSATQIPGFGDMPVLGRLFGYHSDEKLKSEIILSITPHIMRPAPRLNSDVAEFESGTEASLHARLIDGGRAPEAAKGAAQNGEKTGAIKPASEDVAKAGAPAGASIGADATSSPASKAESTSDTSSSDTSGNGSDAATLSWSCPASTQAGGSLTATLNISSTTPLTAIPLAISYDPAVLSLQTLEQGGFMAASGAAAVLSQHIDAQSGNASVLVQASSSAGGSGSGSLLQVVFKPLKVSSKTTVVVSGASTASGTGGKAVTLSGAGSCVFEVK